MHGGGLISQELGVFLILFIGQAGGQQVVDLGLNGAVVAVVGVWLHCTRGGNTV